MIKKHTVQALFGWEYFSYRGNSCCEPRFQYMCQCQGEQGIAWELLTIGLPHFSGAEDVKGLLRYLNTPHICFQIITQMCLPKRHQ